MHRRRRGGGVALILGLASLSAATLLTIPLAQAYPEEDAGRVRRLETGKDDVLRAWHEPQVVQPGTQWKGFIEFRPGHAIEAVHYQICRVGSSCFGPPAPAARRNDTVWSFDTSDYPAGADPVDYRAGWRIGVGYILDERLPNGTLASTKFPEGMERPDDLEYHYLAFDMPPAANGVPSAGMGAAVAALAAAAGRRRAGARPTRPTGAKARVKAARAKSAPSPRAQRLPP